LTQKFGFSVPGASVQVPSMMRVYAALVFPVSPAAGLFGLVVCPLPASLAHAARIAGTKNTAKALMQGRIIEGSLRRPRAKLSDPEGFLGGSGRRLSATGQALPLKSAVFRFLCVTGLAIVNIFR
jgi:hypothetical protein